MPILQNPETGELRIVTDPSGLLAQGWHVPTDEQADEAAKSVDFGTFGQQAQAQGERVLRGATLGLARGFGSDEDIQARADVSEQEHPALSFAADVLPQVALGAATGGLATEAAVGLGAVRGGLAAGAAALAGESAAGGLVGAAQAAYERHQYLGEDPGLDAENALIFGGLNFGLGAASYALFGGAAKAAGKASRFADTEAVEGAERATLEDVAKGAEQEAASRAPNLAGKTLEDMKALALDGEAVNGGLSDLQRVEALKADPTFAETGRVAGNDGRRGITVVDDAGELVLRDGRHRLQAARDLDRDSVYGRYVSGETGETLFEGEIPLKVPGAEKAVQRQAESAAVEDGMDRALNNASRSEANEVVEQAIGGKLPSPEADSFGRQRRLYQNREAILDVSTREMQRSLTDIMADLPNVAGSGKVLDVSANVSGEIASQRLVTDGIAKQAAELAGTLRGEARAYAASAGKTGLQYPVPGQKGLVLALMDNAKALTEAKTGRQMFEAADAFKRSLQDYKLSFEQGAQNSLSPIGHQELIPRVGTLASQVRSALEDPAVWGKAGDMQKAYNAVIHDQLLPSMKVFEESVLKRTSKDYQSLWKTEGWESKIQSLLKGDDLGKQRHVNAVLDALDQLSSVRSQYGDAAAGKRMAEQVAKVRRTMGLAEEVQDASARMGALGQVAGAVPIVGGLAREYVTGDLANAFRRLSGAVDRGIDRGVDDWIASSRVRGDSGSLLGAVARKTAQAVTGAGEDSAIAQIARRQGISHGLARFMGSDQTPQAAFQRNRAALQNDEQFFQAMGQDYKSLQERAPETYLMLAGRAAGDRAFLQQRLPVNSNPTFMRPDGNPPSRDQIEDFAMYWNALKDPMRVVSNIGSARVQELQTLQERRPRLYERTQMRVLQKIAAAQLAGKPLDDALLMRLSLLFPDADGAGSPAFSRKVGQMARDYNAAQAQMGQASAGPAKPRAALSSAPVGGIAQTGATFGTGF